MIRFSPVVLLVLATTQVGRADLVLGTVSDFNDGTTQGWATARNNTLNPSTFLQVLPAGPANRLAVFNTSVAGTIGSNVTGITVDMMRPTGQGAIDMRLVLFGPGTSNRWTTTLAQSIPGDGVWRRYSYSILEQDLTQTLGLNTYDELTLNLSRMMFRYDAGAPSATGTVGATGVLNIDNVTAVPEPGAAAMLALCAVGCGIVTWIRRPTGTRRASPQLS